MERDRDDATTELLVPGRAAIRDVGALNLARVRIVLYSLVQPLPPLTDIGIAIFGALCLNPPPEPTPSPSDPPSKGFVCLTKTDA